MAELLYVFYEMIDFVLGHVLFFSMFLVTRPRSFRLKTKQKKKKKKN